MIAITAETGAITMNCFLAAELKRSSVDQKR